jgi:hypothetical protein
LYDFRGPIFDAMINSTTVVDNGWSLKLCQMQQFDAFASSSTVLNQMEMQPLQWASGRGMGWVNKGGERVEQKRRERVLGDQVSTNQPIPLYHLPTLHSQGPVG